jgi:hypothetical protein
MKTEILILVEWGFYSGKTADVIIEKDCHEIYHDDINNEGFVIRLVGLDDMSKIMVSEHGLDLFHDEDYPIMVDYIKEIRGRKYIPLKDLLNYETPNNGSFYIVLTYESWQSNRFDDPVEWDEEIKFVGILGESVKLMY